MPPVQAAVERRPTVLLVIVLISLFLLMSRSSRTRVGETRTLFERSVMTIFSPIPKLVNRVGNDASDAYHGYVDMRRAVDENAQLRRKVAELTGENLMLRRSNADVARLRALLNYSEQFNMPTILSQVVMLDTSGSFRSVILDRGSDDGVEVNDAVVNANGLVGRVILTTKDMAKVQLIIDTNSAVGALFERSRRQGVVRGTSAGTLEMSYVPSLTDVVVGDTILTAGIDGVYPKGIPVGRVVKIEEGKDLFKRVTCRPTVDFGSVEELIILKTRKINPNVMRYEP